MRMSKVVIAGAAVLAALATAVPASAASEGRASPTDPVTAPSAVSSPRPTLAYPHLNLPNGNWAQVYSDGIADVHSPAGKTMVRWVPMQNTSYGTGSGATPMLPGKGFLISDLTQGPPQPYAANEVVAIYRSKTSAVTHALAALGTDRSRPLFTGAALAKVQSLRAAAQQRTGQAVLDFPDAVLLHITDSSVPDAVTKLRANQDVAFAEPDWIASPTDTTPVPVPAAQQRAAASRAGAFRMNAEDGVPANYDLSSSAQSLLNAPGVNAVPAFAEISKRYGQLPGQGEIITNVSVGTLDDASAANPADPCNGWFQSYGPTTIVQDGQRYLNWPSMPLIPTYTASSSGTLDPLGETCGDDPSLTEVGLDFSMMAPLPHPDQRADETGSGLTDLLGIAPGASYRLVVPAQRGGAVSDIDTALLAAASQSPAPDVITASLGFGFDVYGQASRYLEDDPMTEAVVASIVAKGIVVCVSANDGLRTYTNAPVAPSGGSVATDVAVHRNQVTDLTDLEMSSVPSRDLDSGSIDVGGSTLNDIFAAPPDNLANAAVSSIQAYPATRYDGIREYSSGFGSRVNVAAPGDNVLSVEHLTGGGADAVQLLDEGGTSASAPETAAAAAVVLQVARLTHDDALTGDPVAVRGFLAKTGTVMPAVPQSDRPVNVGPQINLGRAVETLLGRAGSAAGVARVAVSQRQPADQYGEYISTATDPGNISLAGSLADAWITIAPDWTGLPRNVSYQLSGPERRLASTPWARLSPAAILASAGLPLVSSQPRSVALSYQALHGSTVIAKTTVTLTFGPCDGTMPAVQAPVVPSTVRGAFIPVRYDIASLTGDTHPELVVSHPGRVDLITGKAFRPAYTVPLTARSGVINVPVSALDGAGVYGIGIQNDATNGFFYAAYSPFAVTRVVPTGDAQPPVPTLSVPGSPPVHALVIGYHRTFQLHYSVAGVPGAAGAVAEFSWGGPSPYGSYASFNNPNGSKRDADGQDSGSVAYVKLPGKHGTVTLDSGKLGLFATMVHMVRVLATRSDGTVTGEASGTSGIEMLGVVPDGGGTLANGFGVNPAGNDGFLTADQTTASGATLGSVQRFDQVTGAVSGITASSHLYGTAGSDAGIFADDTGLYVDQDPSSEALSYDSLHPVAAGTTSSAWTPPAALGTVDAIAPNTSTHLDSVLSGDLSSGYFVTSADISADTFGKPVGVSSALTGMAFPEPAGFAVDPETGQSVADFIDGANPTGTFEIVTVDGSTGQVSAYPGPATWPPDGMAVDHALGEAYMGTLDGLGAVNLTSHASQVLQLGGGNYQFPTVIPGTDNIMVEEIESPGCGGFWYFINNNCLSSVVIADQAGKVLHRYQEFNFFNIWLSNIGDYLQINPATSTGWVLGPGGTQLEPFSYAGSLSAAPRRAARCGGAVRRCSLGCRVPDPGHTDGARLGCWRKWPNLAGLIAPAAQFRETPHGSPQEAFDAIAVSVTAWRTSRSPAWKPGATGFLPKFDCAARHRRPDPADRGVRSAHSRAG